MASSPEVRAAVIAELDERAGQCVESHADIADGVVGRLNGVSGPAVPVDPHALDLGVWIDDPPTVVLRQDYLDRLREMPLSHVSVLIDGPDRGASDIRWDPGDLQALARELPDHGRVLAAWMSAKRGHVEQLESRLPPLLRAFGASAVEVDCEPRGDWIAREVDGYKSLGDASRAAAEMLRGLPVKRVEVTTFPAALRHCLDLIGELAETGPTSFSGQFYAVKTRGGEAVGWDGDLGPVKYPHRAINEAHLDLPPDVEVVAGLAAYRQKWPSSTIREGMTTSADSARSAGARRIRWWSSKWLCRNVQRDQRHAERRAAISAVASPIHAR